MGSGVNAAKSGRIRVPDTVHVQTQNVVESRPQHAQELMAEAITRMNTHN